MQLDKLTKTQNYYFLLMRLLYWTLQNAIYQFFQHSSKFLRTQSVDFSVVSGAGACAQMHCMCFLILIFFFFFPHHVKSVFSICYSPWKLGNFLCYLQIPTVLQSSCHRSIQLILIVL